MTTTTDMSKFGHRELEELRNILNAWMDKGLPTDFSGDGVHAMFNMNSGNVFLTNEDYQVAMLCDGELESFYSCPECGCEGFNFEFRKNGKECCNTYLDEILI